jgi:hypothetical protein
VLRRFFASFLDGARVVAMKNAQRKTVKASKTSAPLERKGKAVAPPTSEAIAKRAYELYLARDGEAGHEVEDWLQAESELRTSR